MNFDESRVDYRGERYSEEEAHRAGNSNLPFSSSSYSPSSSSSSFPHFHTTSASATIHPGNSYGGPHTRLELMHSSNNNAESSTNNQLDLNNNEGALRVSTAEEIAAVEKEHMFDKVVTPSDVGKLNRLVIPKQHAEKYFPLDASTNEKGLLLNFEDKTGKPWCFRYSYWNSSQSYVMTKGWSRFVKDKKLDAGDVVSFQRGLGELAKDRLYIDWRRRPNAPPPNYHHPLLHRGFGMPSPHYPWSPLLMRPPNSYSSSLMSQLNYNMSIHPYRSGGYISSGGYGGGGGYGFRNVVNMNPVYYTRSDYGGGGGSMLYEQEGIASNSATYAHRVNAVEPAVVLESVPVVHGKVAAAGKRLRLFGVNMDCAVVDDHDQSSLDHECDVFSSTATNANTAVLLEQPPLEFRLYEDGGGAPATTDFFNRGKTSSSTATSMSLDFSMCEQ